MQQKELQIYDFFAGTNTRAYEFLGSHRVGTGGYTFRLYAPQAQYVELQGDFLAGGRCPMRRIDRRGVWEVTIETAIPAAGMVYTFCLDGHRTCADPYARQGLWDGTVGSIVCDGSRHAWREESPKHISGTTRPICIYEVHLSSFATRQGRSCIGGDAYLSYRELGSLLASYAADMGFTHVRLMPLTEHSGDGSLGDPADGFFAPTSRHGSPDDLREMIDLLHARGIGVLMDLPLTRHAASLLSEGEGREFDLTRPTVQSFLLSAAFFWMREFHLDGLCFRGLSALRGEEERAFVRVLFAALRGAFPDALFVSDGSGEGADLLAHRRFREDLLACLCASEGESVCLYDRLSLSLQEASDYGCSCLLSLSAEREHGGRYALLDVLPGGYLQRFALARLALAYQLAHPGKKQLFMGDELGQLRSWDGTVPPDWFLRDLETHAAFSRTVRRFCHFYRGEPRLWQSERGSWETVAEHVVLIRRGEETETPLFCLFHFGRVRTRCRCPVGQGTVGMRVLLRSGEEDESCREGAVMTVEEGAVTLELAPCSAYLCEPIRRDNTAPRAFVLPPQK